MMSERKSRLLWPLLTAALIGLPVLYIASVGPAVWLLTHGIVSADIYASFVKPYVHLERHSPEMVSRLMNRYRRAFTNLELNYGIDR